MRLGPSKALWLVAAAAIGLARGDDIAFVTGIGAPAVIVPGTDGTHAFGWQVVGGTEVVVETINLYVAGTVVGSAPVTVSGSSSSATATTSKSPPHLTTTSAASATPTSVLPDQPGGGRMMGNRALTVREVAEGAVSDVAGLGVGNNSPFDIIISVDSASATSGHFTLSGLAQMVEVGAGGQKMWFELVWGTPAGGKTYSRAFTVTDASHADALEADATYSNTDPVSPEVQASGSSDDGGGNSGMTTKLLSSGLQTATAATAAGTGMAAQPGDSSSSLSSSTTGGLSSGAKIGIAVAVALVGLALLAGLAWFLVRRRRQAAAAAAALDDSDTYLQQGSHTPELLMTQKEARAVGVEVTSHSPYSDDGANGVVGGAPEQQQRQSLQQDGRYSAFTDRASLGAGDSVRESVRESVQGTPRGAVQHLVEEGMTEDEIRRLEEEERELDQAIEQAGAGRAL